MREHLTDLEKAVILNAHSHGLSLIEIKRTLHAEDSQRHINTIRNFLRATGHTPMNHKRPLTDYERSIILDANSRGLSLAAIKHSLQSNGFRRGIDLIRRFLRDAGYPPNYRVGLAARQEPPPDHHHSCVFCAWHGSSFDYYSHWRDNHRRRCGYSRAEIPSHA